MVRDAAGGRDGQGVPLRLGGGVGGRRDPHPGVRDQLYHGRGLHRYTGELPHGERGNRLDNLHTDGHHLPNK